MRSAVSRSCRSALGRATLDLAMSIRHRLARLISSPRAPWIAAALAVVLSLPSLAGGFAADDHGMVMALEAGATSWNIFDISQYGTVAEWRESGFMGWWAADDLRIAFLRPISSITHWLDCRLWPASAWAMHLGNILIYGVLVLLAGLLFRNIRYGEGESSSTLALATGIAALLFAVDDVHAQTLGWISSRNSLLCAAFGFAAILAHDRWRREGWRGGALLAPLLFLASLLSAEGGLACAGYLFAHALFLDRGTWKSGLLWLLPYALIVVAWRLTYTSLGYGAVATGLYLDIAGHPFEFLLSTLRNGVVLILAQLTLPFSTQVAAAPGGWVVAGVLLLGLCWLLWPLLRRDRLARFWALGMVLAALPFGATIASDRVLVPLGLGASGLIARLVIAVHEQTLPGPRARWTSRGLLLFNALFASLLFVPSLFGVLIFEKLGTDLDDAVPDREVVVVMDVPLELVLLFPGKIREHSGGQWPDHVYPLFAGTERLEIERTGERTLELWSESGWLASPIDRVGRSLDRPFEAGDRVDLSAMSVEVLEVSDDGRPLRARFLFDRDLDRIGWVGWDENGPGPWEPPAVGERASLTAQISM